MNELSHRDYRRHDVPDEYLSKWQETIDVLADVFNVPAGLVMRVLPEEIKVLVSSRSENNPYNAGERASLDTGLYCETVMATRSPLHVPNALEDPEWQDNPDVELDMISYIGMPLIWPDDSVFGTVCILDKNQMDNEHGYLRLVEQFKGIIERDFQMLLRNAELQQARKAAEQANQRMRNDLDAAARIQLSLLPNKLFSVDGVDLDWFYQPCDELAGDGLNLFKLSDHEIALYVLDVSGHGVPSALLAVSVTHYISQLLESKRSDETGLDIHSPTSMAARLNTFFPMVSVGNHYFTFVYGVLDLKENSFCFVSAGGPGPLVVHSDGSSNVHDVPAVPLGVFSDSEYINTTIELNNGDRLYLHSDGLYEERKPDTREMYGRERMQQILSQHSARPFSESIGKLVESVVAWRGDEPFSDDVAIIGCQIRALQ